MRLLKVSCFLLAGFIASASCFAARPNVVVIYTDDQGSLDANCYGSNDLDTPTFDRLASEGVRFTQMYSPSAICSASRAGLMTGRFPARAGVPGNVSSAHGHAGMPPSEVTMAELLKSAGYAPAMLGNGTLVTRPKQCRTRKATIRRLGTWADASITSRTSSIGTAPIDTTFGVTEKRSFATVSSFWT